MSSAVVMAMETLANHAQLYSPVRSIDATAVIFSSMYACLCGREQASRFQEFKRGGMCVGACACVYMYTGQDRNQMHPEFKRGGVCLC